MKLITDLQNRVKEFNNGLQSGLYIQNILLENEAYIIDMNATEQLFEQGINNLGVPIDDYAPYTPYTIQIKQEKGQPTNRVTLHDEGDFSGSFYMEVGNEKFEIKAGDFKTHDLMKKYGRQILGLTNENIKQLIWQYIYPDIIEQRKKLIYGKK